MKHPSLLAPTSIAARPAEISWRGKLNRPAPSPKWPRSCDATCGADRIGMVVQFPTAANQSASPGQFKPLDEAKLIMASAITHELRTPLTILKGRLHGIEDGVIPAGEAETARLLRQVEHVLAIVNDLDLLTKSDLGRLTIVRQRVDAASIVAKAIADLRDLFARHDITIRETLEPIMLEADPVRLTQVVTNLLTNAAKHSPIGGCVTVELALADGEASLRVQDEGPGITPGDEHHLFKPFWRSAETIKRPGCPGTGMGLALTARLVEAHDGRISAGNRADRNGACFEVVFPTLKVIDA